MVETVLSLYSRIPRKWKLSAILWMASFLFGLVFIQIWGIGRLLVFLIILGFIAALFRSWGLAEAFKLERWALDQFWGRIRGMFIFALLPAAWEAIKNLISNPSTSSIIGLLMMLLVIAIIWDGFEQIRKGWRRVSPYSRRRQRR